LEQQKNQPTKSKEERVRNIEGGGWGEKKMRKVGSFYQAIGEGQIYPSEGPKEKRKTNENNNQKEKTPKWQKLSDILDWGKMTSSGSAPGRKRFQSKNGVERVPNEKGGGWGTRGHAFPKIKEKLS